ncbi:MAG: hypothetical protein KJ630_22255 [Proteobacteria bacterium]|nr:hypothetical protein [Pseudomonadota bacterium]
MVVKLQGQLGDVAGPTKQHRLTITNDSKFDLDGDRLVLTGKLLTASREELPSEMSALTCPDVTATLAASPYIQADRPEIMELARQITAEIAQPIMQVKLFAGWVYQNLEKRPVIAPRSRRLATGVTLQREAFC